MINLQDVLGSLVQVDHSGGIHTHPSLRLILFAIAVSNGALDILELGYDAGWTTETLAMTGAKVIGIDNLSEYGGIDRTARERLAGYTNCKLLKGESLQFLNDQPNESFDFVFVDDNHNLSRVKAECERIRHVLRPGGIACFHDTNYHNIWSVVEQIFADWQRINFKSPSASSPDMEMGLGIVKKPTAEEVKYRKWTLELEEAGQTT